MELKSVKEADVKNKRILVRCGFDVPFNENGEIVEDARIHECKQTFQYLIKNQAKLILCSHNGRPKGKVVPRLSMDKIKRCLEKHLNQRVIKLNDCIGPAVEKEVFKMKSGEIILLENLRFHIEEEENESDFTKQLAGLAEVYVNEAFANCHRDHASMTGVPEYLPAYAGFRLQKEVETLAKIMEQPERPFVAVIGGAKISDKIQVIKKFIATADHVLLGGALANTILKAQGLSVGKSLVEEDMMKVANYLPLTDTHLHVPVDVITASEIAEGASTESKAVGNVGDGEYILDIGPDTINLYEMIIKKARTVVWGGPMGYFEIEAFTKGSYEIAKAICRSEAVSIVGGGDTIEALDQAGCLGKISFVSTGGGAMLKFLEQGTLVALKPLIKN